MKSNLELVREQLECGAWITPYEMQRNISNRYDVWISDGGITARMRDLRKAQYGAFAVPKRLRKGTKAYEYRLHEEPQMVLKEVA